MLFVTLFLSFTTPTLVVAPNIACKNADSTMVFVLEKKKSLAIKGKKAYRFSIDGKGNCFYENLLLVNNKSAYRTTLTDSSAKMLYKKISEISWKELVPYSKSVSLDSRQSVLIQYYSSATGKKNIRVPNCRVVPELYTIESAIENIIATAKWNKINPPTNNH
jgi:hypothetical protein